MAANLPTPLGLTSKLFILKMRYKEAGKKLTKVTCNKTIQTLKKYLNYIFN